MLPQSSLAFQFEHQPAQAIEATDNSHWHHSAGDIRPENSHLCRNAALDTLPPVEPASKIDMTVTELDTRSTWNTLYPCYANSVCYDNTITLPGLASSVQHEHILGHPLEQLPACSPPEHPCQDRASVATFSHEFAEPPENPELSCHTYVSHSQPQGHISFPTLHSPFCLETTHSNNLEIRDPIDASLLFVVDQTQCGENISHYHNDSVCESSPFECTYNSFAHQFDEYSSIYDGKQDEHKPMTRRSYSITPSDTLRNGQTGRPKCDYTSPVTGEPCLAIISRLDEYNGHEGTVHRDS